MNFQINKTIWLHPETGSVIEERNKLDNKTSYEELNSSRPYMFYHLENPYLKTYDNETWSHSQYSNKTETREF